MSQMLYPPANGASLGSYLVKKGENMLTKIALSAKLGNLFGNGLLFFGYMKCSELCCFLD